MDLQPWLLPENKLKITRYFIRGCCECLNACPGSWHLMYLLQMEERKTHRKMKTPSYLRQAKSRFWLVSGKVTREARDFRKRPASGSGPGCWLCPGPILYSGICWWGVGYSKSRLWSTYSVIQIRNCISAYWNQRNFTWLSETWGHPLIKAWIKTWRAPNPGNQNMGSTTLPARAPRSITSIPPFHPRTNMARFVNYSRGVPLQNVTNI